MNKLEEYLNSKGLLYRRNQSNYIVITNHYCLFIEMTPSKWIDALNSCYGVRAMVCYGCDEAITFIEGNIPPINHNKKYQELMEK